MRPGLWEVGCSPCFLRRCLIWVAVDTLAPAKGTTNHLFPLFAETSGIAYFEPTGRFVMRASLRVLAALLIFVPVTRRVGAILGLLVPAGLAALVVQLMMLQVHDTGGHGGRGRGRHHSVSRTPAILFYLIARAAR